MARIFLADDDTASLDLVRRALESDGHTVQTAESGTQADEWLAAKVAPVDLLVTDINMPGMNGFQLVAAARARQPGLCIIMMSGLLEQLDRAKTTIDKPMFTIPKPFTLEQMRQVIRTALSTR